MYIYFYQRFVGAVVIVIYKQPFGMCRQRDGNEIFFYSLT